MNLTVNQTQPLTPPFYCTHPFKHFLMHRFQQSLHFLHFRTFSIDFNTVWPVSHVMIIIRFVTLFFSLFALKKLRIMSCDLCWALATFTFFRVLFPIFRGFCQFSHFNAVTHIRNSLVIWVSAAFSLSLQIRISYSFLVTQRDFTVVIHCINFVCLHLKTKSLFLTRKRKVLFFLYLVSHKRWTWTILTIGMPN